MSPLHFRSFEPLNLDKYNIKDFALCIQPELTESFEIFSYKLSSFRAKSGEVTFIQGGGKL